ncbi:hypothetical protein NE235_12860 [Actinoallomurus spadix]|uniref:DUF8129 domain-containing protein n=1 Tax=Actinoallomurus spadix TaxID=79912 RepID=A0ABN0X7K9_9ACTN|nr:hypothetical protein [Actinoallomurus spadix]MCO5986992.1 hypothetical protein [Actinoallomurus spadix]
MTPSPRRLKDHVRETVSELPIHAARLAVMGVGQALLLTDRVRKDYKEARESGLAPVLGRLIDDAEDLTGRVVGKVTGLVTSDGRTEAEEGAAPATAGPEIAVGKPAAAAGRTRPATPRPKPPTRSTAAPAKGRATAPSRAKGTTPAVPSDTAAARRAGTAETRPAKPAGPSRKAGASGGGRATGPAATEPKTATRRPSARSTATPAKAPASSPAPATEEKAPTTGAPQAEAGTTAGRELPIADYDHATIASVRARLRTLNARQINELRDYERAHAARAEFLRMFENRIAKLRGQA